MNKNPERFLAIDLGLKQSGIAVGNSLTQSAAPHAIIKAEGKARITAIEKYISSWQPDALVIGIPYHPDGAAHEMTQATLRFARQLRAKFALEIFEVDERYSTTEAISQGAKKEKADAMAACIILEQFLREFKNE